MTAKPGPILVIAGAGSGKTRTLTYRVAYLIENGVEPENILLLTFTNKASREMLDRVGNLLPHDISRIWGGTFHSVANRLLRRHANELGFSSDFTILDRDDAADLAIAALKATGLDTEGQDAAEGRRPARYFRPRRQHGEVDRERGRRRIIPTSTRSSTSSRRSSAFTATARRSTT